MTSATTAGYPKPLWHRAIKVIALLGSYANVQLEDALGLQWQKVLSLQPDLPAQPQEKLEDTSLDTQEPHTPQLSKASGCTTQSIPSSEQLAESRLQHFGCSSPSDTE